MIKFWLTRITSNNMWLFSSEPGLVKIPKRDLISCSANGDNYQVNLLSRINQMKTYQYKEFYKLTTNNSVRGLAKVSKTNFISVQISKAPLIGVRSPVGASITYYNNAFYNKANTAKFSIIVVNKFGHWSGKSYLPIRSGLKVAWRHFTKLLILLVEISIYGKNINIYLTIHFKHSLQEKFSKKKYIAAITTSNASTFTTLQNKQDKPVTKYCKINQGKPHNLCYFRISEYSIGIKSIGVFAIG
ncbi:hypothetical protein AGLY_007631 [Aphis glycines]|uniref:Uncharacterized protein n=1 Tax=Aphis glycines TaxID=307491 RepID=A0A6G0TPU4_APHGL|nr:hypothetical protein AGLY_007631 [Aphis glycines]